MSKIFGRVTMVVVTVILFGLSLSPMTAAAETTVPASEALATLGANLKVAWGHYGGKYLLYQPDGHPAINRIDNLQVAPGRGYLLFLKQDQIVQLGGVEYDLRAGQNIIGWVGGQIPTQQVHPSKGLAPLENPKVWTSRGDEWFLYPFVDDPGTPKDETQETNELLTLIQGQGYWVRSAHGGNVVLGGRPYTLEKGWNLIGWLGYSPTCGEP